MNQFNDYQKEKIIKWILSKRNSILIKDDFHDSFQIVFNEAENKFVLDNWSPRENITYSQMEISLVEAWNYATLLFPQWITKAAQEVGD